MASSVNRRGLFGLLGAAAIAPMALATPAAGGVFFFTFTIQDYGRALRPGDKITFGDERRGAVIIRNASSHVAYVR